MKRIALIGISLCAALLAGAHALPDAVVYPSVTPADDIAYDIPVRLSFSFEGVPVTVDVSVGGALYEGAARADKTVTRFGNAREDDWIDDYFPAFVDERHHGPFYDSLLAELRRVRDERGLDADRYAELLTVFAQSIIYTTDPDELEPKFPVETFVEATGDCDDKALLLAGLLSREGYDVAIFLFEPEKHVALGIRCDELDYRGTGYAYTETTADGFIGMVPEQFSGGMALMSHPLVFKVGVGARPYTAGGQVRAILEGCEWAATEAAQLADEIAHLDETLRRIQADVRGRQRELDRLGISGEASAYTLVSRSLHELIDHYNDMVRRRNELADRHNGLARIDRIVAEGLDDRLGTYAAVRAFVG
ncbi:MAG: hypothetical protein ACYC6J_09110 [Coriobacteriia bacterium]